MTGHVHNLSIESFLFAANHFIVLFLVKGKALFTFLYRGFLAFHLCYVVQCEKHAFCHDIELPQYIKYKKTLVICNYIAINLFHLTLCI